MKGEKSRERIIVALDVPGASEARPIVDELAGKVGAFKIGLQLFTAEGAGFVRELTERGLRVFLDVKFHDIPTTVAKASVEVAKLGVWMFNVHASGGGEMMRTAADAVGDFCSRSGVESPLMIGVTVLTSSNESTLLETGVSGDVESQVVNLARLTAKCGLHGVVASAREISPIRNSVASGDFVIVTPGIRPQNATNDDQKRVMTPREAVASGSDFLVIGRPITHAADRLAAVEEIIAEMDAR